MRYWDEIFHKVVAVLESDGWTVSVLDAIEDRDHINEYNLHNNAWMSYKYIQIGTFDCSQNKVAALFHEWGHSLTPDQLLDDICDKEYPIGHRYTAMALRKTEIERQAWKYGFSKAKELGITFDYKTYRYAVSKLKTYYSFRG